jgi:hypothetical protein
VAKKRKRDDGANVSAAKLTIDELARLLTKSGGEEVTVDQIQQDIEAGAPTNDDGSVHLLHYTAWLATQVK